MQVDPRFALLRQLLTTTTFAMAIPSFTEEFGDNKSIDVIGTLHHEFISSSVDSI